MSIAATKAAVEGLSSADDSAGVQLVRATKVSGAKRGRDSASDDGAAAPAPPRS